jgi:Uma2 family endonuclease
MTSQPAAPATLRMSEEEFLANWVDLKPSYEFVNGEVTQKPMTNPAHRRLAEELIGRLWLYRRQRKQGLGGPEPTVNLSRPADRRFRVPDLAYWAPGKPEGTHQFHFPPTLAVEIMSPGQTFLTMRAKCREYRRAGVEVVWLVSPTRRSVEVFEEGREGEVLVGPAVLGSPHLPGFAVRLPELFAVLDE